MKTAKHTTGIFGALMGGVAIVSACSSGTGEDVGSTAQELTCNLGLPSALSSACTKSNSEVSVTASRLSSANPAQVTADNAAYGVRLVTVNGLNEGALRFVPLQTTSYNIYLGTPNLPFRIVSSSGQVVASCTSTLTAEECNKLRRVNTYQLTAGETYRIEIPPTATASYLRLYIQTRLEPIATCDGDDLTRLGAACADAAAGSTKITASSSGPGVALALNTVYTVTLPTVGTNTYAGTFSFTPDLTADYELLLGTPKIPVSASIGASPVNPDCSRQVPAAECNLLRRGDRFSLQAGVTYSFTLGPNVNTQFIRTTIRRSVGPDECALGTDNCDHDPNACVNSDDGFSCVCPPGYVGDGVGAEGCAPEAVNECALGTDNCDDEPDACVDTAESFECVCPAGYAGDGVGSEGCAPDGVTSSQSAYLVPVGEGVQINAILTVGDSPNLKPNGDPYRMVGLPDGLGAFDNGDGTFTLLSNHELVATAGIVRAHGGTGAFVSRWQIRKSDLHVLHGEDLTQVYQLWTAGAYTPTAGVTASRFCSADLPAVSAFYNAATGLGTTDRFFMNGEESGAEGRGFAHGMDGTSWELPRLGKMSFENSVASPGSGDKTVVFSTDDSTGGQLYVYVGQKTDAGSSLERAGLTNGTLYGVKVTGFPAEDVATGIPAGAFELVDMGNVENTTGAALESASVAAQVTAFLRPEDAAWDPSNPNDLYFVTTASFTTASRLWRLRFTDVTNPALGGTIEMMLDGSEGQKMLDNIGIDGRGHIIALEDPGNNAHLSRVWRYDIATDAFTVIAQADPDRFVSGAANFLTQDEEASGVIDASDLLGAGWWLIDLQAQHSLGGELVVGGQYLAIYDPATAI